MASLTTQSEKCRPLLPTSGKSCQKKSGVSVPGKEANSGSVPRRSKYSKVAEGDFGLWLARPGFSPVQIPLVDGEGSAALSDIDEGETVYLIVASHPADRQEGATFAYSVRVLSTPSPGEARNDPSGCSSSWGAAVGLPTCIDILEIYGEWVDGRSYERKGNIVREVPITKGKFTYTAD